MSIEIDGLDLLREQWMAEERAAWDAVRDILEELVEAAEPIWRIGDGQGGAVLRELWVTAEAHGFDVGLTDSFAARPRVLVLAQRDGWKCHYCSIDLGIGDETIVKRPVIEHVLPRVQGGTNVLENLVLACSPCNGAKGPRTPVEWLGTACCDRHGF